MLTSCSRWPGNGRLHAYQAAAAVILPDRLDKMSKALAGHTIGLAHLGDVAMLQHPQGGSCAAAYLVMYATCGSCSVSSETLFKGVFIVSLEMEQQGNH